MDEYNILSYIIGNETYVFIYSDERANDVRSVLCKFAFDCELGLTPKDASHLCDVTRKLEMQKNEMKIVNNRLNHYLRKEQK